jgi:hypothetical protein
MMTSVPKGVKFMLFLYCFSIRKHSSQVQVLWEDHRNDLFINGFGLLMSAGGSKWAWCMHVSTFDLAVPNEFYSP